MVLWTLQFKFQFCVHWVLTELYTVTVCTASVNLIGISRRSASTSECSNPSPSAAAEDQDLKAMQSHISAHPGGGAGVPQSPWAQHWSPSAVDRAMWGFTPHRPVAVHHPVQAEGSGALCGSTACGRQHQVTQRCLRWPLGLWAWPLLLL